METKRSIIEEALLSLPDDMQEIKDMQKNIREASTIDQKNKYLKIFLLIMMMISQFIEYWKKR